MKDKLSERLGGGDLRSIGNADLVADGVCNQNDFDALLHCLYSDDRLIVMRAADAIEKITAKRADYLRGHEAEILTFCKRADNIEFKWHLALLLPRISLSENQYADAVEMLSAWLLNASESKIVRANSMQALFELSKRDKAVQEKFDDILSKVEKENIPSLLARIRKIRRNRL